MTVQMSLPKMPNDIVRRLRVQRKKFYVHDTDYAVVVDRTANPHVVRVLDGEKVVLELNEDETRGFFDAFYETIALIRKEGGL